MDVIIRDIDPQYIQEIDKKAKLISSRTGMKFSRNDYFKLMIRQESEIDLIDYKKAEYDIAVDKMILSNEKLSSDVSELTLVYERIFNFILSEGM